MDFSPALRQARDEAPDAVYEARSAPRFASLIRAAKIHFSLGEFVCVIRDVSATGVGLRGFHGFPAEDEAVLELGNGMRYPVVRVRQHGFDASYRFADPVDVEQLISESWQYKKRQLRLAIAVRLTVTSLRGRFEGVTENLSQQGCRLALDEHLALDQPLRLEGVAFPEIRAKVRWRREACYGLVFDDTFSLRDFALLVAAAQAPELLPTG